MTTEQVLEQHADPTGSVMRLVRRVTGIASLTAAGGVLAGSATNYLVFKSGAELVGADALFWVFQVIFWVIFLATLAVLAGLILGWRLDRLRWAPGLVLAALGLVSYWGWMVLNRQVDLWPVESYLTPSGELRPEVGQVVTLAIGTDLAVTVVTVGLLILGGVRILRSATAQTPTRPAAQRVAG